MSDIQDSFNDIDPETLERNFERQAEINRIQSETIPSDTISDVPETKVVNNPVIAGSSSVPVSTPAPISQVPTSHLAQPKPVKAISRQERRLMEREAAKAAKRKTVPIALHSFESRDEQASNLTEQLKAIEVYDYLPNEFHLKLANHTVTGETWEADYPIEQVGRTLEVRFYNDKSKHSYSNFRNTASTTRDEKQQRGYDRLEAKLKEVRDAGTFSK